MKYGLRKDENMFEEPKKKWRKAMEDIIKRLEFEMKLLKGQLQEATDRIQTLEPKNQKINIFFTEERESQDSNTRSVRYQKTVEWENNRPEQLISITAMPEYQHQSLEELRLADYSIAGPQQHRLFVDFGLKDSVVVFTGTEYGKYQRHGIWDVDPLTWIPYRYNSITILPEYGNKSFEELRLEDYILKALFSKKTQFDVIRSTKADSFNVKQRKQLRNAGFRNKNSEVSDPNQKGDSWTSYEDYESTNNNSCKSEHARGVTCSTNSEELFNQMLLSLNKMETHLSDVNCRLSSMDSGMSDLKSQVSVMDSRLSAVDMFVAMERVDKKWRGLEPQLANLDTPTRIITESPNTSTNPQVKDDSIHVTLSAPLQSEVPIETKSFCESESLNIIKSSDSEKNNLNLKVISTTLVTSNDSVDKIYCKSVSSQTQRSDDFLNSDTNFEKSFSKESKIENDNTTENNLVSSKIIGLIEHSLTKTCNVGENDSINLGDKTPLSTKESHVLQLVLRSQKSETEAGPNKSNSLTSFSNTDIVPEVRRESTNENSSIKTKERNIETNVSDQETCVTTEAQSLNDEGNTSDNDYVIVEKKDVDDVAGQYSGEKGQCSFGSKYVEDKDFKLCSNITEYLEENLGKKKDVVYEFGFEVKTDFSGTDSLLETSARSENDTKEESRPSQSNTSLNSTKDDSFFSFVTWMTEQHHERPNQSSPVTPKEFQYYKKKHLKQ